MTKRQRGVLERTVTALLLVQLLREEAGLGGRNGVCSLTEEFAIANEEFFSSNAEVLRDEVQDVLEEAFPRWEHYSGDVSYPVPSGDGYSPGHAFHFEPHWEGHGLTMRTDLIAFLISDIERRLA